MSIRVLPSKIQARTFELLGADPKIMDLTEAIALITKDGIDAQENPLTNTVTYGVHKFHRFHTISNHFYISRPIFLHRPTFESWPADLQAAMQRAIDALRRVPARSARQGRGRIRAGDRARRAARSSRSTPHQHKAFAAAVQPIYQEARQALGDELFKLAGTG